MHTNPAVIEQIRAASRSMARAWGFLGDRFAGTTLSPSAVHALIEIDKPSPINARELGLRLQLEKSSISRLLRKLIDAGDVLEETNADDARVKVLSLTESGKRRVAAIHSYARTQVSQALDRLKPEQVRVVLQGLSLYTSVFQADVDMEAAQVPFSIEQGYQPGLIARITQMHALYYARTAGLGQHFESVVASGLAAFCSRLENPKNAIWTATLHGEIIGSVAIDGEDLGGSVAHLRWFIVDDGARGSGLGRELLGRALAFVDQQGFEQTRLWTFDGLTAARHLYESQGFVCVEEKLGVQWGKEVLEQRFERPHP